MEDAATCANRARKNAEANLLLMIVEPVEQLIASTAAPLAGTDCQRLRH